MARKLPKAAARSALQAPASEDAALKTPGEGGVWGSAQSAVMGAELSKLQAERLAKLRAGDLAFELDPAQIIDEVGSDRAAPWLTDEAFLILKESIERNGQDTPIQVTPADPEWIPRFNETEGLILRDAAFKIISGRRRLEAAKALGRKVRAVCAPPPEEDSLFHHLHRRYRENVEREDLTYFEELLAIGELCERGGEGAEKLSGRAVAKRLGVTEGKVSKARAVYGARARLFEELENPHLLTLHQLDAIIPALRAGEPLPPIPGVTQEKPVQEKPAPVPLLKQTRTIEGRKVVAKAKKGRVTLELGEDFAIDDTFLEHLLIFIQAQRQNETSKK